MTESNTMSAFASPACGCAGSALSKRTAIGRIAALPSIGFPVSGQQGPPQVTARSPATPPLRATGVGAFSVGAEGGMSVGTTVGEDDGDSFGGSGVALVTASGVSEPAG